MVVRLLIWDETESEYAWNNLLQLLDSYPLQVETKERSVNILAKLIIITSNVHPHELFGNKPNNNAFLRRLTLCLIFTGAIYQDIVVRNTRFWLAERSGTMSQKGLSNTRPGHYAMLNISLLYLRQCNATHAQILQINMLYHHTQQPLQNSLPARHSIRVQ